MAAFAGALGSLAESYGLAREQVMEERRQAALTRLDEERMRQERVRTRMEQTRLQMEQDLANRPMFIGQPYTRAGKQYIRTWEPKEGKLGEMELGAEESSLQKFYREAEAVGIHPTPAQALEATWKVKPITEMAGGQTAGQQKAWAWHFLGKAPAAGDKDMGEIVAVMRANKWGPGKPPTGSEADVLRLTKEASAFTKDLRQYIRDNKLEESNNWLEGTQSVLSRHLTAGGYLLGHAPEDPVSGRLIRMGSAIKILGAQPYMRTGRGKYMFNEITQHLPAMGDTPMNMYQKAGQLQIIYDRIMKDISTVGAEGFDPEAGQLGNEPDVSTEIGGVEGAAPPSTSIPAALASPAAPPSRMPTIHWNPDGSMEIR